VDKFYKLQAGRRYFSSKTNYLQLNPPVLNNSHIVGDNYAKRGLEITIIPRQLQYTYIKGESHSKYNDQLQYIRE